MLFLLIKFAIIYIIKGTLMINMKIQKPINKKFDDLCMIGDLDTIDNFAKENSANLTMEGDIDNIYPIFYRLVKKNKLDVIKYLFTTPYINEIPQNIFWDLNTYEDLSSLELLYENGHKNFIKELLTNKNFKDNPTINQMYSEKMADGSVNKSHYSDFLELVISKKDWEFVDYLLHCQDIKYPIKKEFSVIKHALRHTKDIDLDSINKLLEMTKDFFKEDFLTIFKGLANIDLLSNLSLELQNSAIQKSLELNLLNSKELVEEIEEKSKDDNWVTWNPGVMNLYKILLHDDMSKSLSNEDKPNKKPKI